MPKIIVPCSIEGCKNRSRALGWCTTHYARWQKYGDPLKLRDRKTCSVNDCGAKHYGFGFCEKHFQRFKKHGTPEPVRISLPMQFISDVALNHTSDECLLWPFSIGSHGYGQFKYLGKIHTAHSYVCELCHGKRPSSKHDATHNCGIRACVSPKHLCWKTHRMNLEDMKQHGTFQFGEAVPSAILTEDQVRQIRRNAHLPQVELASLYGVNRSTIGDIIYRRTWAWLD